MESPVHWHTADAKPTLTEGNVHVWRSSIDVVPEPRAYSVLDTAERNRLSRIRLPVASAAFVAAHYFVRSILAIYLGVDPSGIQFDSAPEGKPRVSAPSSRLQFNLSHSHGLAMLAVGQQALGIDIERLRPIRSSLQIARRVLPTADVERLTRVDEPERSTAFLECWTRFEARQKALGRGVFAEPVNELAASLSFRPDAAHLACLAWRARDIAPKVFWLDADISP